MNHPSQPSFWRRSPCVCTRPRSTPLRSRRRSQRSSRRRTLATPGSRSSPRSTCATSRRAWLRSFRRPRRSLSSAPRTSSSPARARRETRAAVALLESECIRAAQGALGKRSIPTEIAEEANQNVRERLLVGPVPKVLEYDGKGDLKSWVRVVVVREAIYLSKRGKKEMPLSFDLLALPASQDDPEVAYFKAHYRAEYKEAFEAAVEELTPRERALLRQQLVLGMNVDEMSAVYQVHRATAARWLQSAREELLAKTRLQLAIRLNLPRAEIENIVRMIESQLVMSMGRLLKATQV